MTGIHIDGAAGWRCSTHSGGTDCVEARRMRGAVKVRDSKRPAVELPVSHAGWARLLESLRGSR